MVPNMAAVHAATIAAAHRRHEKERKEREEREREWREAQRTCTKTLPCEHCLDRFECTKTKIAE